MQQEKPKLAQPGPILQILMMEVILPARPGTGLVAPTHAKRLPDILL